MSDNISTSGESTATEPLFPAQEQQRNRREEYLSCRLYAYKLRHARLVGVSIAVNCVLSVMAVTLFLEPCPSSPTLYGAVFHLVSQARAEAVVVTVLYSSLLGLIVFVVMALSTEPCLPPAEVLQEYWEGKLSPPSPICEPTRNTPPPVAIVTPAKPRQPPTLPASVASVDEVVQEYREGKLRPSPPSSSSVPITPSPVTTTSVKVRQPPPLPAPVASVGSSRSNSALVIAQTELRRAEAETRRVQCELEDAEKYVERMERRLLASMVWAVKQSSASGPWVEVTSMDATVGVGYTFKDPFDGMPISVDTYSFDSSQDCVVLGAREIVGYEVKVKEMPETILGCWSGKVVDSEGEQALQFSARVPEKSLAFEVKVFSLANADGKKIH